MRKRIILTGALVVIPMSVLLFKAHVSTSNTPVTSSEVVKLGLDFQEYESVTSLKGEADAVVIGVVMGSRVISEPQPIGESVDGTPIPSLPHTHHTFLVRRVVHGKVASKHIVVSQIGGTHDGISYVAEELPALTVGQTAMLFLDKGQDGIYYPLAGGTAVAAKRSSDVYQLPAVVNGDEAITINPNAQEVPNEK